MVEKLLAQIKKLLIGPLETNLRSKIYFLSRPQNFATEVTLIQHPPPQSALATHRPFPCDPTPSFILQNLQRLYLGFPIIFCRYLLLFSDYVLLMPDQNFTVNGEIPITLHTWTCCSSKYLSRYYTQSELYPISQHRKLESKFLLAKINLNILPRRLQRFVYQYIYLMSIQLFLVLCRKR